MTQLREQMIRDMEMRRLAPKTQEAYVSAVSRLAKHYKRSPDRITTQEVHAYLHHLLYERNLSWSSCDQVASGVEFFYRTTLKQSAAKFNLPRRHAQKLPEVLSAIELDRLFRGLRHPQYQMIFKLAYAYSGPFRS